MREFNIRKTQFTVLDFLSWQREETLDLNPSFQRRAVWKPDARSYFIDTVVKGLPSPIIYLRQRVDLDTQKTVREVVDGQQRLRTVLTFVDPWCLNDIDPLRDRFVVKKVHNAEIAGKPFEKLSKQYQERILEYELSTHILPITVEDREVLEMFSRLNATGVKLNRQELRNAEYYGQFKSAMYELGLQQFDRWREWKVFTDDQISRMSEVELTSDVVMNMIKGLTGKTQKRLDDIYKEYDDEFPLQNETKRRFQNTMDEIDRIFGQVIRNTVFTSEVYFFSLFVFVYEQLYGLGSPLTRQKANHLPHAIREKLLDVGRRFQSRQVPDDVLDAVQRASSDFGRRRTRLRYMIKHCER